MNFESAEVRTDSFVKHKMHSMLFIVALIRRVSGTRDKLPFDALWRWARTKGASRE